MDLGVDAMGGRERLVTLTSVRLQAIGHTLLVEQSYRQDPFIAAYARTDAVLDLANGRLRTDAKSTWPQSDAGQSESRVTLIVGPEGGVHHAKEGDSLCGLAELLAARQLLELGPLAFCSMQAMQQTCTMKRQI